VVGDPADLSAVYYNPGGFALNDTTEFLLAGLGVEFTSLKVKDVVAEGGDLTKSTTRLVPSLIAGEIPIKRERHRFAYSLLTRHRGELQAFAKIVETGDFFELPELSLVSNSKELTTQLSEYWIGGTWSWRARPSFGVGVSTFVAVRNQRASSQGLLQILSTENRAGVFDVGAAYKYQHWRMLWKIGAAGELASWKLGVTATIRSWSLGGTGDVTVNRTVVGQIVDENGDPLTSIATNVQFKVPATYQSPFSVAVGATRRFGSTSLHLSAEWFESISLYKVVAAEPFEAQSSGEMVDPSVFQDLDSVTNVAIATEHVFESGTRMYAGFHTDFSAANESPTANMTYSKWDLYHVSGGATFDFRGTALTLGADFAFASDTVKTDPDDPFRPVTLPDNAQVRATRLTLILGFNFSL
jgi:hypothetical protein